MKREGFISVIILMLMTLVMASCTYMTYFVTLQANIVSNNRKTIQARLSSEDKANRLLYDSENLDHILIPRIYNIVRTRVPPYKEDDSNRDGIPDSFSIDIPKDSDLVSSIKSASIRLEGSNEAFKLSKNRTNYEETTSMILNIDIEDEGRRNFVMVTGKPINRIFELEEAYISETILDEYDMTEELHLLLDKMNEGIQNHKPHWIVSANTINLEGDGFIHQRLIRDEVGRKYEGSLTSRIQLINSKATWNYRPKITIENTDNDSDIFIKGNIYCEGDLIIKTPFRLQGNLIIDGGSLIIEPGGSLEIEGKLIYRGEDDLDFTNIVFSTKKEEVYYYGVYLPGFIDLRIDVIKTN